MVKPTYIIIGAGKCGTTALADTFRVHPQIFVSRPKEPNFFSDDAHYARGLDYYFELFRAGKSAIAIGEASGRYSCHEVYPETARRMFAALPECKLIYLVRNPFERIESLWIENAAQGLSWVVPFKQSLREQADIYLDSSNYLKQIDRYREFYSDEQIKIVFYEDLFGPDSSTQLKALYTFLGVDAEAGISEMRQVVNESHGKLVDSPVLISVRAKPVVRQLKRLLPAGMRSIGRRLVPKERLVNRPDWGRDGRSLVMDALGADTAEFLARYGRAQNFWGWYDHGH